MPKSAVMSQEKDVKYFRELLKSETALLSNKSEVWQKVVDEKGAKVVGDEVDGLIRTTIGQAKLLMKERFKQFSTLVDDCENKTGEKPIHASDLAGFWDMIDFQVLDVKNKFDKLATAEKNEWKLPEEKIELKSAPAAAAPIAKPIKNLEKSETVKEARSNIRDFIAKQKQQNGGKDELTVTIV